MRFVVERVCLPSPSIICTIFVTRIGEPELEPFVFNLKSPRTDDLTAEFYSFFWDQLSNTMINSFNYGFVKGELSISQRQGIIRLIPTKNKNLLLLKNWRPISLVDYKIATKALALRLRKVLPSIISDVHTGYILKEGLS